KQLNFSPIGNKVLLEKKGAHTLPDTFKHEQSLVINEDNNVVLMAGCAHNGIVNILEQITERSQLSIKHVFGGFHLYNLTMDTYEDDTRINQIANELLKTGATFYTGHCTGLKAYELLKLSMNDKIEYNSVGTIRDI
ncbi:MAG: MBL fold metallo-hydrolase, partial [Ignavibacteria bacterium]|nr:MBL fold metallo-hydrolase [Ignavibacteria bacterium]